MEELVTVDEVADYLKVHPMTIYRWCREGRLPAIKIGKEWRIRRSALDDFLQRGERKETLVAYLQGFFETPDDVIAFAETEAVLHRLDAAFFQMAEARGGVLVKFYSGEPNSADELRVAFTRGGLDVAELEDEDRFRFYSSRDPLSAQKEAMRKLLVELTSAGRGRTIYAAFDWLKSVPLDETRRQQEALMEIANAGNLVIKTSVLARVADEWTPADQRLAQFQHRGTIWLSDERIALSRTAPTPKS